ncbi:MAG: DUF6148 family protein [Prochlorococcaceae cyanobacterium]|jgi:hypothetical protein
MAGITLTTAQAQLDAYLAAETAILSGQEYSIGTRRLKRADLAMVQAGITLWNQRVQDLTARQRRGRYVVPSPNF